MTKKEQSTNLAPQPAEVAAPVQERSDQQSVQYVMTEASLRGVGGWLVFWMIIFSLAAITYISLFFGSMLNLKSAVYIVSLIFSPFLILGYTVSVILMAMQKRLAKLIIWITLSVSAIYAVVGSIVGFIFKAKAISSCSYSGYGSHRGLCSSSEEPIPMLIAGILIALLVHGLVALYFVLSRRVKETLVN